MKLSGLAARLSTAAIALVLGLNAPTLTAQQGWSQDFDVTSQTFQAHQALPLSAIFNSVTNGVNACSPTGAIGGDMSPELTWTPIRGAKSYAVVLFDTTASFTHWGIYNIKPNVTSLPANAGVAMSTYGTEINNDFGDMQYDGPCPPPGLVHHYVFTVYALDTTLDLPSSTMFPANAETLFRALIGHVIDKTSIEGNYASTPQ